MKGYRVHLWILILLAVFAFFKICWREVPLDRVGVKSNRIGKGVAQKDYPAGYCFVIPGLQRLYLMDPTLQDYTMASDVVERTEEKFLLRTVGQRMQFKQGKPISLRAQDDKSVDLDITVLYRIKPGRAHRVLIQLGADYSFHAILDQQARRVIWEELAKLESQDFYNAEKRATQAELARRELNKVLDQYNLEVVAVLIRNIDYQQEMEQVLVERQLINQRREIAERQKELETAKARTQMVEEGTTAAVIAILADLDRQKKELVAKAEVEVAQILADARYTSKTVVAEAESYKRQQIALGELAKTTATAVGEQAVAAAYEGLGGELYLAKQVLEGIEIGDIEINTNQTNPFDVERMLEMIGLNVEAVREEAVKQPK